ncbi:MAG: hypothetical protein AAF799_09415 [Myxococcota bacterium]
MFETIAFGFVEDMYVTVHRAERVAEKDWAAFVAHVEAAEAIPRMLVIAGPGKLDPEQRHFVRGAYDRFNMRIGVLADSRLARGILTALNWFGVEAKAFQAHDLDGALSYLGRDVLRAKAVAALATCMGPGWLEKTA